MVSPDIADRQGYSAPNSINQLEVRDGLRNEQRHIEQMETIDYPHQTPKHPRRSCFLSYTAWVAMVLAPVTYLAGVIANEDVNWKIAFFMLFSTWLLVIGIGVLIDLSSRDKMELIKRPLWHVGCCLFIMYIILSTVEPPPDHLPQWIPGIIDIGLGVSIGIQEFPSDTRRRAFQHLTDLLGSIYGCICPNARSRSAGP
ncbi:hypothetical protein DL95DRAFT_458836 [Leptodontidium sp. 2 PMI_412]|nr:hypothetical protein DL95DRAFT_458836 [Leptodontidium sp. 2 PMI_412]